MTEHPRSGAPRDLRRANTAAALRSVLDEGPLPRADLAARLGLAQGTISRIVGPFVGAGVLRELPAMTGGGGRPRVPLDLAPAARLTVGLHIGRQRTSAGLVDLRGTVRAWLTHERGGPAAPEDLIPGAADLVRRLLAEAGGTPVLGIGAATGGWVDPVRGTVVDNEALGWRDVPLRALLTEATGQDTYVDSGARAHATAEVWFGRARTAGCSVHLFTGNVIDAAVAIGRRVHPGARFAAGTVAHLPVTGLDGTAGPGDTTAACACGRRGVLQAVATDSAVLAEATRRGLATGGEDGAPGGLPRLAALARQGDEAADGLLRARARHIGTAVTHLVELLDPDLVVLSGGVLAVPDHLEEVRRAAAERLGPSWDPEHVQPTALGAHSLAAASAALLLRAYYDDPLAFEDFG
ncbi:ROK family protein [Streptomyces sp. NPDC006134]|uniref:ROK family transcriptional regulator n=1 Tax=Streptomyces sp. NPDC006134 TaxID=3154467 RepID=UPI0033E551A9